MRSKQMMMVLAVFAILALTAASAFAGQVTLTVGEGTGTIGTTSNPANIPITAVAKAEGVSIAGAAFTVTYDSTMVDVAVESSFFDTFVNQGYTTADGLDDAGAVDSYSSPLVTNVSGGLKIAAARHTAGDISTDGTVLFTLVVNPVGAEADIAYPISITATTLTNTEAGYSSAGEQIDLLVGADASITDPTNSAAYPVVLAAADTADIVAGSATFTDFVDTDGDGIDDNWECSYFPDETSPECLTHLQADPADYDSDGISDYNEYTGDENGGVQSDPTDPSDPNAQSSCASRDFDDNGAVDGDDFLMFIGVYPSVVVTGTEMYDLDSSGNIDGDDFLLFIECYPTAAVK